MSTYETAKVLALRGLTDRQFRTLIILAEASSGGDLMITDDKLAEKLELAPNVARASVIQLCEQGVISPLAWARTRHPISGEPFQGFVGALRFASTDGGDHGL